MRRDQGARFETPVKIDEGQGGGEGTKAGTKIETGKKRYGRRMRERKRWTKGVTTQQSCRTWRGAGLGRKIDSA